MPRPRSRPGLQPSWTGTNKKFFYVEDGQSGVMSVNTLFLCFCLSYQLRVGMDATRISDGRPVMLKMLPREEGPHELGISKLFSTEPLTSDPRNHCVRLLDVIELPDDPPIIVHPFITSIFRPAASNGWRVRHFLFSYM